MDKICIYYDAGAVQVTLEDSKTFSIIEVVKLPYSEMHSAHNTATQLLDEYNYILCDGWDYDFFNSTEWAWIEQGGSSV